MRPFGCPVTILNTIDHLDKFDGKADEGFIVGYSLNSKAFRVFNSRTRIVKENLHIRFSESTPNVVSSTKASDNADLKSSQDDGSKPSSDDEKKVDEDSRKDSEGIELPLNPNMPELEDYSIFDSSRNDEDNGAEADINNLDTTIQVSPIPNTRIHKDHPLDQLIRDLQLATQTRRMSKSLKEHGKNPKRAIGTTWVFRNKKDERGIMIRNKARLVAQGYTQEEGIDYDEVFSPVARIEAIRLFLAYASFKDFVVYQMDVKIAFVYEKIEEEVYVCQPLGFGDPDFPNRVYKVEKALYGLHQAPRAWYETLSTYLLDNEFQRGKIDKTLFIKRHKDCSSTDSETFPIFCLLAAYTDSDYAGASLDRKSTIRGCQFLGCRLISWQCKKQTVDANSTIKAEYVVASSCCRQPIEWYGELKSDLGIIRLVPSCFVIFDLEPLSLSFEFVFMSEIFKSLSFSLDRLCHLAILCLDQHAHTLHLLESLLTISLDRLDILKEDLVY
ncbi:retrovirus-related pol polyprotein from transposon TNT 1-94 [Tanacetum coccineum]